jgi:hypothetical protein
MPAGSMGLCIVPVESLGLCIVPVESLGLCIVPVDSVGLCIRPGDGTRPGGLEFDQRELPVEARGAAALKGRGSGHLPLAHIWSRNVCTGLGTVPVPAPWVLGRFHGVGSMKPGFASPPGALPAS